MIQFDKEKHQYKKGEVVYDSVTTVIKKYTNEFDAQKMSLYKACKDIIISLHGETNWSAYKKAAGGWESVPEFFKRFGHISRAAIMERKAWYLALWDEAGAKAREAGTIVHAAKEAAILGSKVIKSDMKGNVKLTVSSGELLASQGFDGLHNDHVFAELIVSNDEYQIAGMVDKVEKHGNFVYIIDYKTSKEIKEIAFADKVMKYPLTMVPDCNRNHYGLQLSLYGWMLEQRGFIVRGLQVQHLQRPDFKTYVPHNLNYRPDLVEKMLKHYRNKEIVQPNQTMYAFHPISRN